MACAFCFALVQLRPVTLLASPVLLVKIHFLIKNSSSRVKGLLDFFFALLNYIDLGSLLGLWFNPKIPSFL